jgi:tight adherence protein B
MLAVTLALALLIVGAALMVAVLMMSRGSRQEIEKRIYLVSIDNMQRTAGTDTIGQLLKEGTKKFEEQVRRVFTIGMARTWAMQTGALTLLLIAALSATGVWLLTHQVFGLSHLQSAAAGFVASFLIPRFMLSRQQKRAEAKFTDLFPDAVDTVSRMVRAGLPITAAVLSIATESGPPVSTVFATIADQMKIGVPIEELLDASSQKIGLQDFRFFTVAIALQYSTGGNLSATLEILSDIIRKRRATRLRAKAATGEIRMTAYILGAIPVLTIGALVVIQPGYLAPLFTDPRGHWIIGAAGVLVFLAFFSMRTMMRSLTND